MNDEFVTKLELGRIDAIMHHLDDCIADLQVGLRLLSDEQAANYRILRTMADDLDDRLTKMEYISGIQMVDKANNNIENKKVTKS